jgi:hypothetical protein
MALKHFFEGAEVIVRMDMPGDKSGIDIYPELRDPVDYSEVGDRLRRYGVALYKGDAVMVTLVKVKNKNIEFHLGGGGARDSGTPYVSTYVPKSNLEKRLEDEHRKETDPVRKKRLKAQLDDERRRRRYEQERLRAEAEQAKQIAKLAERELRAQGGSRFNLWYEDGVPLHALTPESVMHALADFVEFPEASGGDAYQDPAIAWALPNPLELRKGMTEEEVNALFGEPELRSEESVGGLDVLRCEYTADSAKLSVQFVGGVLVRYVLTME